VLLVLTFALGYAAIGPIRHDPDRPLSVPAVLAPATPESAEATPTTDSFDAYPSFTTELAAGADLPDDLEAPVMLSMIRLTLDPGATYPLLAVDPTTGLLLVESGTFTVTLESAATVRRAAGAGTPFPEVVEELAAGTEFTMAPGDSALFPAHTVGEFRNNGSEPAVALVALLLPASAVNG
jgi:mannose-6-phosphate isomerase-like protein (cupin superfamily)